jgi:two-component system, NtrC family, sensor kinase
MTSKTFTPAGTVRYAQQIRHGVAKWLARLSLRARLSLLVALVVAGVIAMATYLQVRVIEGTIEQQLVEDAASSAQTIAHDLRTQPVDSTTMADRLNDLAEANPYVRVITIVVAGDPGTSVLASTSSEERVEALDLGRTAIKNGVTTIHRTATLTTVATPIERGDQSMAVVVTVSMGAVERVREQGRAAALWFAVPTILFVVVLVDLLARRLVHRRIALVLATMRQVSEGNLTARTSITRRDELGTLAEGLNEMLARMERFNVDLRERVQDATAELRERNVELEESYRRVLSLREALGRAERMAALGQMAANIAHQVGTPLNLISGHVQVLREEREEPLDTRSRARLEVVARQIQQVTRVLRAMLDQVHQPSPREPVDLTRIIEQACETARPRIEAAGIVVDVRVDERLPRVDADVTQLEAALLNLITNSLDAMTRGGRLTISAIATDEGAHIEVADTGAGFHPSVLPRVFDPWVTTKPVGQGTGLGLGIAREVVKAHGGRIEARNRPEGGAVVVIDLPCAAAPAAV